MNISRENIIFILIGPSASGKGTMMNLLRKEFASTTVFSVSATTRGPRPNEKNGVQYYFLSEEDFKKKIENDEFLEWEPVHTSYYGTLKSEYHRANDNNLDLLLDIDIKGAINIKNKLPDRTVCVFLVPPSFEAMEERIRKRAGFKEEDFANRLKSAQKEYDTFLSLQKEGSKVDYFVVNDEIENAYNKIRSIYISESLRVNRLNRRELEKLCVLKK